MCAADVGQLLGRALAVGEINFRVMKLLSESHSEQFGHPEPTEVGTGAVLLRAWAVLRQGDCKGI